MSMKYKLYNNREKHRYEFHFKEYLPYIKYSERDNRIVLIHTDVPPDLEGHGIGTQLVKETLDDIRTKGEKIIPLCPFVVEFIERNPEYSSLI